MRKRIILITIIGLLLALLPLMASAEPVHSGDWGTLSWTIDNEGLLSINGIGNMRDLGNNSTNAWLEYRSEIKTIEISNGITSISHSAFYNCGNLTSITIPDSVTSIDHYAFYDCSNLINITIPDNVTFIGQLAFDGCSSLTSISVPDGVTSISDQAFYRCSSLSSITIPDSVTSIGSNAFGNCSNLISIDIPSDVTSIRYSAFYNCYSLTNIVIPSGVTIIDNGVFLGCSNLTSISIPDSVTNIGDSAFYNCSSLTSISIPDSVTNIGDYAFRGCSSLTSISIPDGVTSIGNAAFYNCSSLTSISIPDSVTSIGNSAFYNCSSLTSINIPDGVTSIGNSAFYNCPAIRYASLDSDGAKALSKAGYSFRVSGNQYDLRYLYTNNEITGLEISNCDKDVTSVVIPDGVTSIGYSAFYNCSSLTSINIPDGVTSIGNSAFYNCSSLTSVMIPDGVTSIGYSAFYNCSSLTSINIPDGVTSIGNSAFYNCPAIRYASLDSDGAKALSKAGYSFRVSGNQYDLGYLYTNNEITGLEISNCDKDVTSVVVLDGVTSIGNSAFYNCSNLTSITIPDGVTSIGNYAFYNCSSLTSISIPDGVTSIGNSAFSSCSSLTSINLPDGVTNIGDSAFQYCNNLANVNIPDGVMSIGNSAFYSCGNLASITIPDGVTSIGNYAFYNCSSLTSISIPDGVTSIGNSAFSSCSSLTSINLPDGVTNIGDSAFRYCNNLANVNIPDGVMSIGNSAFYSCGNLASITIPAGVTTIGENAFGGNKINPLKEIFVLGNDITLGKNCFPVDATLYCYSSSSAYEWGFDHEMDIVLLDGSNPDTLLTVSVPDSMRISVLKKTGVPATISPRLPNQVITWESSDEQILTVDQNGIVTPVKVGTATVSVTVDDVRAETLITVAPALESINIDYDELYITPNSFSYVAISLNPADALYSFAYNVDDQDYYISGTIDEDVNGYVLFLWNKSSSTGRTTLTIRDTISNKSLSIPVRVVRKVQNVTIDATEIFISQEESKQLIVDIELSNGMHTTQFVGLSCSSDNSSIVTVDKIGKITGIRQGNTTLHMSYRTGTDIQEITIPIHVNPPQYIYLPKDLLIIEAESFYGSNIKKVIIPEGCQEIGSKAFAYCQDLKYIQIPASVITIADDAFEGCNENLVIEWEGH